MQADALIEVIECDMMSLHSVATASERVTESGYLVIWRAEDHLIGFVYRSRQRLDIDRIVADAPRLLGLVRAAL